jgi:hypothetical protein
MPSLIHFFNFLQKKIINLNYLSFISNIMLFYDILIYFTNFNEIFLKISFIYKIISYFANFIMFS